jgi:hypothetical protein
MPALVGSCNKGATDYEVTGTVTHGDSIYNIIISFGGDQPVAGTYKTLYQGIGSMGLTDFQCRIEMEITTISTQNVQTLKAKINHDVVLVKAGDDKYKASFGAIDFAILPGGSAVRVASASAFGCE